MQDVDMAFYGFKGTVNSVIKGVGAVVVKEKDGSEKNDESDDTNRILVPIEQFKISQIDFGRVTTDMVIKGCFVKLPYKQNECVYKARRITSMFHKDWKVHADSFHGFISSMRGGRATLDDIRSKFAVYKPDSWSVMTDAGFASFVATFPELFEMDADGRAVTRKVVSA